MHQFTNEELATKQLTLEEAQAITRLYAEKQKLGPSPSESMPTIGDLSEALRIPEHEVYALLHEARGMSRMAAPAKHMDVQKAVVAAIVGMVLLILVTGGIYLLGAGTSTTQTIALPPETAVATTGSATPAPPPPLIPSAGEAVEAAPSSAGEVTRDSAIASPDRL